VIEIGCTTQGRPLRILKISNGPGKKAIFADAGIHAREWLSIPVALKIAFELLENYSTNKALVDMVDWYILPVANPDGYIYSWRAVILILTTFLFTKKNGYCFEFQLIQKAVVHMHLIALNIQLFLGPLLAKESQPQSWLELYGRELQRKL
jgi:hypothetical protein